MTEYDTTNQEMGPTHGAAAAETVDLLIRHLEVAKRVVASPTEAPTQDDGEAGITTDTICTLLYATSGTFCPLLYVHGHLAESVSQGA